MSPIESESPDGCAKLRLARRFRAEEGAALIEEVRRILASGTNVIALDMSEVEHIDSAGMGMLVGAARKAHQAKGRLELHALTDGVRSMLRATGLLEVFWVVGPPPRPPSPRPDRP